MEMKVEMEIVSSYTLFSIRTVCHTLSLRRAVLYLNLWHTHNDCVWVFLFRWLAYARHIIVICRLLLCVVGFVPRHIQ